MTLEERLAASLGNRYSLLGEIGRGGMASVFRAQDLKHDRRVAIKVLHPELTEAVGAKRFLREISTAAALTHPHILPLHDSGEADGLLYYIMPYVQGESLRARIDRDQQLPVKDAVTITLEVASALAHAHGKGFVHRDVKPANILLESGQAVLADFGLAQALADAEGFDSRLTQTGISVGTPSYMSPEQASGQVPIDGRSDQYSLATVLYEMLAGEAPFPGSTAQAILAKKLTESPPPLSLFRSTVSKGLEEVVNRALQRTAADRFPSMADFSATLQAAAVSPSDEVPAGREGVSGEVLKRSRSWPLLATLATVTVLIVAWATGWFEGDEPPWGEGYPRSMVVLPFTATSSTEEEGMAALEVSDLLARELDWWDSVRAIGSAALTGIIHDLGSTEPTFRSSEAAIRVARQADVDALLGITVRIQGDSAFAQGTLYDAAQGRLASRQILAQGRRDDLAGLVSPIAFNLLGIGDGAPSPRGHGTRDLSAFRAFLQGRESFFQSNLRGARDRFREAVQRDSLYAPALSWLALSLYWDAIEGTERLSNLRPEIARLSTYAKDRLSSLTGADSLHVDAFFDFQGGDYEGSRRGYQRLVGLAPEDIAGWLMLGELELNDLWMVPDSSGVLKPRADLNLALAAFQRTTEIRPTFELGYARSFSVAEDLGTAARNNSCPLFGPLRSEPIPPGSGPGVENAEPFCPVFQDSIQWIPKAAFDSMDPEEVRSGVDRVFDRFIRMLDAWESFAPSAPRPKELLAEVLIDRRESMGVTSPQRLRSEAARALERLEAALALRSDTTPQDLFLVANLQLASGATGEARALAREALAIHQAIPDSVRTTLPLFAANVFLGTGQMEAALWVARQSSGRRMVRDPDTGELIDFVGGEPVLMALTILGAGGVRGEPVQRELTRLDSIWKGAGYTPHQMQLLRNSCTNRIGAVLVQDPVALEHWEETTDTDQHLWADLGLPVSGEISNADYSRALVAAARRNDHALRTFLIAWRAREAGAQATAQRLFNRLDSLPNRVGSLDSGWGLSTISLIPVAEILEAQGHHEDALQSLRRFLSIWEEPDSLGQLTVDRAVARLQRMQAEPSG